MTQPAKSIKNRLRNWLRTRLLDLLEPPPETDPRKQMSIGRYTYGLRRDSVPVYEPACHSLQIGSYCSIAAGVRFVFGIHQLEAPTTFPMREFVKKEWNPTIWPKEKIIIGHDVWIATNAMILPNVTIGHGAVICAGAVVTKDVPPYAVVAGIPARPIKYRLTPEQIHLMLEIAWWDWPENQILENLDLFYGDVDAFIRMHRKS